MRVEDTYFVWTRENVDAKAWVWGLRLLVGWREAGGVPKGWCWTRQGVGDGLRWYKGENAPEVQAPVRERPSSFVGQGRLCAALGRACRVKEPGEAFAQRDDGGAAKAPTGRGHTYVLLLRRKRVWERAQDY